MRDLQRAGAEFLRIVVCARQDERRHERFAFCVFEHEDVGREGESVDGFLGEHGHEHLVRVEDRAVGLHLHDVAGVVETLLLVCEGRDRRRHRYLQHALLQCLVSSSYHNREYLGEGSGDLEARRRRELLAQLDFVAAVGVGGSGKPQGNLPLGVEVEFAAVVVHVAQVQDHDAQGEGRLVRRSYHRRIQNVREDSH